MVHFSSFLLAISWCYPPTTVFANPLCSDQVIFCTNIFSSCWVSYIPNVCNIFMKGVLFPNWKLTYKVMWKNHNKRTTEKTCLRQQSCIQVISNASSKCSKYWEIWECSHCEKTSKIKEENPIYYLVWQEKSLETSRTIRWK